MRVKNSTPALALVLLTGAMLVTGAVLLHESVLITLGTYNCIYLEAKQAAEAKSND